MPPNISTAQTAARTWANVASGVSSVNFCPGALGSAAVAALARAGVNAVRGLVFESEARRLEERAARRAERDRIILEVVREEVERALLRVASSPIRARAR